MMRKNSILSIFVIICSITWIVWAQDSRKERKLYDEICTQGNAGYKTFRDRYFGNKKKEFWIMFDRLVRNFDMQKQYIKILACSKFWSFFKEDTFFNNKKEDKADVEEIFTRARKDYKTNLLIKMAGLEPIDSGNIKDTIIHHTKDRNLATIVENYQRNYPRLERLIMPKDKDEVERAIEHLGVLNRNYPLDKTKLNVLENYLNLWRDLYSVGAEDYDSYSQRADACRKGKNTLGKIHTMAKDIVTFGIKNTLPSIQIKIDTLETDEKKWQAHDKLAGIIRTFENKTAPTVDDFLDTKEKINNMVSNISQLAPPLKNAVSLYLKAPNGANLTINNLYKYLQPRWNNKQKLIRFLKRLLEQDLFAELANQVKRGGESLEDVKKVCKTATDYKNFFNKNSTRWDACLSLLKEYYKAKKNNDYPSLLALYEGHPTILQSCSEVFTKWNLMSKTNAMKKYEDYFKVSAGNVLGNKRIKKRSDFIVFKNLYEGTGNRFSLEGEWQSRFDLLNKYFMAMDTGDQKEIRAATGKLQTYFPKLAASYSISMPRPIFIDSVRKNNIIYTSPRSRQSVAPGGTSAGKDYGSLKAMWNRIKEMKTEQRVREYLFNSSPIKIKPTYTARDALEQIFNMHNKWVSLQHEFSSPRLDALYLIAKMQTQADNPDKQNEIYNYIFKEFDENEFQGNQRDLFEEMRETIDNNTEYLKIRKFFQRNRNNSSLKEDRLALIDSKLDYELLTVEQQIQAYYFIGALNENIPITKVPECYYYGKAWKLMKDNDINKINALWIKDNKSVFVDQNELKAKVCKNCNLVNNNAEALHAFNNRFKYRNVEIDDFLSECLPKKHRDGNVGGNTNQKSGSTSPSTKNKEEILTFLDTMYEFVKKSSLDDPAKAAGCSSLVTTNLKGEEFVKTKDQYKDIAGIPDGYDALMNQFFYTIYHRKGRWKEKASAIIEAGNWGSEIDAKMKNIFENTKIILGE